MSAYADMWNLVDISAIVFSLIATGRFFLRMDARTSVGVAAFLQWMRCLTFLQGFSNTGSLIRMINEIIKGELRGISHCTAITV